jgi:hypothetical protein
MASDSTRFVGHLTAKNDPSGRPNDSGSGPDEGAYDASDLFAPVFHKGAATAGGGSDTVFAGCSWVASAEAGASASGGQDVR